MILYCVRHGESVYNAERRIQGQSDPPLSPLGERQAVALALELREYRLEAIFASPLARAYRTAEAIAHVVGLEIQADPRLMELNAGIFQGLQHAELAERWPAEYACWKSHDPDYRIPQGESRRDLMRRGEEAFAAIRESGHQRVAVVSHGGILTAAFKALLGIPAERQPFSLHNGSINCLEWTDQPRLISLNEIAHLRTPDGDLSSGRGDL